MIVIVKPHEIFLKKEEEINEKEVNISKCIFEFDEEITDEFVKEAIFVKDSKSIVKIIDNNECDYPPEILDSVGVCLIGVVATLTHDNEIIKRFNPSPQKFSITDGILREADNSQPITASELEQYKQALQNRLNEVKTELEKVIKTGNAVAAAGVYAEEQGNYAKGQAENIINSNDAAINIIKGFEENVDQHITDFNENANSQTKTYNDNAKEKLETYNSNAETKTTDFNKNVSDKTTAFNTNAETKTTEYNTNADTKLQAYDDNASAKVKEYNDNATSKVEEYNQNADDKTEEFNKNADSYETRITENEKDIVDIESYLDNLTPKSTASGELVHITDALGLPTFETKTSGNVKQETTTGKNLLPYPYKDTTKTTNGITFTDNGDGTITANGTASDDAIFLIRQSADELASFIDGTNYILSGCFNDDGSVTYNNAPYYIANDWVGVRNFNTKGSRFIYSGIGFIRDFKIVVKSGTTVSNLVFKPMIRLATITDDTYEPYTGGQASPNPNYQQEVEVLEPYNLFNSFIATKSQYQTSGELQIEKDGSFILSGNTGSNNYFGLNETLGELCPSLKVGDNVYLHLETTCIIKNIYIGENWANGYSKTITQAMLDRIVVIYGGYNQTDKIKIQVSKEPIKPYLPYGCVGYKVIRKNWLDISKTPTATNMGISISYDEIIKKVRFKGTAKDTYPYSTHFPTFIPKGTYTFSSVGNANAFIWLYDKDGKLITTFNNKTNRTITLPRDAIEVRVGIENLVVGTTYDLEIGYQLEKGSVATEIEDYQEQIVPLGLKGNWVGKINDDIKDYLVTDKKRLWLVKNVEKGILSFKRIWANDKFKFAFFDKPTKQLGYGEYLRVPIMSEVSINTTSDIEFAITSSGNQLENALLLSLDNPMTIEELKALADGKPFYYPTKETEIIDLGELPEPIKTFEGTNNIQVLANLDTEIETTYALDLKKYTDNKLAEISSQLL